MKIPAWTGCAAGLTVLVACAWAAGAQQVTLPLPQYEELRSRANPAAEEPPAPPAPYALESADFAIMAGATSARITQTLVLSIYADGWQRVPLGEAGSFTSARFGDLEGRVEVKDDGWALQVKGRGRHEVKLESVVPVRRDETAIRPAWSFKVRFPPAAVVRGLSSSRSAKALISSLNVAENKRFCRCLGSSARMRLTSGMKPMSSMRSASSSTRISTCDKSTLRWPW